MFRSKKSRSIFCDRVIPKTAAGHFQASHVIPFNQTASCMKTSRRHFLKTSASLSVAPFILPSKVWADPPSKKLAHAAIGIKGRPPLTSMP